MSSKNQMMRHIFSIFYIALLVFLVVPLFAAHAQNGQPEQQILSPQKAQPLKILGISVEGNKLTEAAAVIRYSGLKIGGEFTPGGDEIRQAIKQLWSLGIFSDIEILIDNQVADGVYLLIKVAEYPRLNNIVIKGNDELSPRKT